MTTTTANQQSKPPLFGKSGLEILSTVYPDPVFIVPEYLPEGLTILSGRPKRGKSYLALQICRAVAEGLMILGKQVKTGRALYIALEDNERRLQDRMKQQSWTHKAAKNITIFTADTFRKNIGALHRPKGLQFLKALIETEGYSFVGIDTFARAFPGLRDPYDSQEATNTLAPLQELSKANNFNLTFVDHQRKPGNTNPDPIDDIFGATGKGGVVDTGIGLYKNHDGTYRLMGIGREIEAFDLTVKFDPKHGFWNLVGSTNQHISNALDQKIIDALVMLISATFTDIQQATGANKGYVSRQLKELVDRGIVAQAGNGRGATYSYIGTI